MELRESDEKVICIFLNYILQVLQGSCSFVCLFRNEDVSVKYSEALVLK